MSPPPRTSTPGHTHHPSSSSLHLPVDPRRSLVTPPSGRGSSSRRGPGCTCRHIQQMTCRHVTIRSGPGTGPQRRWSPSRRIRRFPKETRDRRDRVGHQRGGSDEVPGVAPEVPGRSVHCGPKESGTGVDTVSQKGGTGLKGTRDGPTKRGRGRWPVSVCALSLGPPT